MSLGWETRMEGLAVKKPHHRWGLDVRRQKQRRFSWSARRACFKGQYVGVEVHAGLICLKGPVGMDLDLQLEMFEEALDELDRDDDLVNQVLEISLSDSSEKFEVLRYKMPAESA